MNAISLHAKPSPSFAQKLAASRALLHFAAAHYAPITQASSLGAEDMVITHLLSQAGTNASIFVLDTGMLHAQTLALVGRIEERYERLVDVYHPDAALSSAFVQTHGPDAMYQSLALRKQCCHIRKMEPLARALTGKNGWITGLRRQQSNARSDVPDVEQQSVVSNGKTVTRAKINPLADWTWGDVWHFIALNNVPYNPLHDQFFPSIGCAPCTRAVTLGEDFRSGRWWWEQESAKECGLHVVADSAHKTQEPTALEPVFHTVSRLILIQEIPA